MAQRRMFSLKIVDSDAFLDMPQSSRLLYYDLSMRADDDGFVSNPKKINRMTGASDDDLKILVSKKFIIPFDSGICVIKHWKIHNYIQKDRYTPTTYLREKEKLQEKENGAYTLDTKCIQNGDTGKVRIGKDSIGKDIDTYGEFKNVNLSKDELQKLYEKVGENNTNVLIEDLSRYLVNTNRRYKSHYATILTWARKKVEDYKNKQQSNRYIG